MNFANSSYEVLKSFCSQFEFTPEGDKRRTDTWLSAATFLSNTMTKAEISAGLLAIEAKIKAGKLAAQAEKVAKKVYVQATSPKAIAAYKKTLNLVAIFIVLMVCTLIAVAKNIVEIERTLANAVGIPPAMASISTISEWKPSEWWSWLRSKAAQEFQSAILCILPIMPELIYVDDFVFEEEDSKSKKL